MVKVVSQAKLRLMAHTQKTHMKHTRTNAQAHLLHEKKRVQMREEQLKVVTSFLFDPYFVD